MKHSSPETAAAENSEDMLLPALTEKFQLHFDLFVTLREKGAFNKANVPLVYLEKCSITTLYCSFSFSVFRCSRSHLCNVSE